MRKQGWNDHNRIMEAVLASDWEDFLSGSASAGPAEAALETSSYPSPTQLYFSTQTFIAQLNRPVDLKELFWGLELVDYDMYQPGILKKQMKFTSVTPEEVEMLVERLRTIPTAHAHLIKKVCTGETFKDIRKVSIGLSKKDLSPNRVKIKGAFFNCLVVNVRIQVHTSLFKDHHVKIFNTGNVEIPGIQDSTHVPIIMDVVQKCIRRIHPIDRVVECKIVLINSHFNINFYVNRDKLYTLLRQKYGIAAVFDPCSYPGVQCKLYFSSDNEIVVKPKEFQTSPVSVMIFRTGSILVVGKCTEETIHAIYEFLNAIFKDNYDAVAERMVGLTPKKEKKVKKWVIKK